MNVSILHSRQTENDETETGKMGVDKLRGLQTYMLLVR